MTNLYQLRLVLLFTLIYHCRRMDDTRLPTKIVFGTVAGGKKVQENLRTKKNWVDCLEEDCARANILYGSWAEKAKNRTTWP
jgi:hypothetical protein